MVAAKTPRRIVILAFPGVQPLDVIGPAEVFAGADTLAGGGAYTVEVVAKNPEPITTRASSYGLVPKTTTSRCRGPIDTLIVAGGFGVAEAEDDAGLIRWIRSAARRSRRVTSVCSGAFLLARAGLLEGKTCTTHWASTAELARRHPELTVDSNPIFVRDGNVWTSAGVTSGMDLSLALVEEDLGRETAVEIARWLVLYLQRPGGQAQFSTHLSAQLAERRPLRELQSWIADNLDADLRVEALADRAAMSPRNFARFFRRETGMTPAAYVEELRVERARQLLEEGGDPIESVSARCGFGTPETMRRAFSRRVGVAPAAYRGRFQRVSEVTHASPLTGDPMQVAYLLYDRFTALDITGPHDVLNSVPGNESIFVAEQPGPIRNESDTLSLVADASLDEIPNPDIVVVPGGFGNRMLLEHEPLHEWIRGVHETSTWTTSVCTGSLLLAAAGLLDGAPATTHWLARDVLAELGAKPVADRVVQHGKIITAAGVSSGIDMALGLVTKINGKEVAQAVQLGIEYDPEPPQDAGSPEKAPPEIVELVTAAFEAREAEGQRT